MSESLRPVRDEDQFDLAAVHEVLTQHIAGIDAATQPSVLQFTAGASNLTYLLHYPDRELVLRRPPAGAKPKAGHSMWREYRITRALAGHYPVPRSLYYASADDSVIGAEFYVMERVDGVCLGSSMPSAWNTTAQDNRRFCEDFWTHLVKLHQLDIDTLELQDFGHPAGYIERQIKGWSERYANALTDDAEAFTDVREWLEANRPATENAHCIVHGDFRMDNIIIAEGIVDADQPHAIRAVLDWEISALGDPLMDLGAALVYWIEADDPPQLKVLKKQPSDAPGMLTRREVIAHYAAASGRDIDDFTFYYVYGIFRLAVIAQQIYYRYYHGQTSNQAFAMYGPGARALGEYARSMIEKGLRL